MSINTREDLRDHIHDIHDYIRNNGGGYGMNALKIFNIIYGLKVIEPLIDNGTIELDEKFKYSNLSKMVNDGQTNQLHVCINQLLDTLSDCQNSIADILFYNIPQDIPDKVYEYIIKSLDELDGLDDKFDLKGKIYEYFIGRDQTAISELGAYFTDRHIVNYIMNVLQPKINEDNTFPTMIDPYGGSGGFTIQFTKYLIDQLKKKYLKKPKKQQKILNKEIHKIYHHDANLDVIKSAALEIVAMSNVCPNMDTNFKRVNSFTYEFNNIKFDFVITNPPYGGDKNKGKKKDSQNKVKVLDCSNRIKEYAWNNCSENKKNNSKNLYFTGDNKENCSLLLIMSLLKEGGTCVGVLKEGLFFDSKYQKLRKELLDNYTIDRIVSVPQDQFENTTTKTSIIFFTKYGKKTDEIKFYDLLVEKNKEGEILKVHDGGKPVVVAKYDEIVKMDYSFSYKKYIKQEVSCNDEFEMVRLGDVCTFMPKSKRKACEGEDKGKYKFYTSSDKVKYIDEYDYEDKCIIIGTGGNANIKIDKNFSCSADNFILKSKYCDYIYFYISNNINILQNGFSGSTIKHISKEYVKNIQIPIPKSQTYMQEITDRISAPYDVYVHGNELLKKLEKEVQCDILWMTREVECDMVRLGDVVDINIGGTPSTKKLEYWENGNNKWVSVKELDNNIISETIKKITDLGVKKSNVKLIPKGYSLLSFKLSIGKMAKTGCEMYCNEAIAFFKYNKNDFHSDYLHYYMSIYDYTKYSSGSIGVGNLNKQILNELPIKIPKDKSHIQSLEQQFQLIDQLQEQVSKAEKKYKGLIKQLGEKAIKKDNQTDTLIDPESDINEEQNNKKSLIDDDKVEYDDLMDDDKLTSQHAIMNTLPKKIKGKKIKKIKPLIELDDVSDT
jgi:type I restriction-modification system DNA methylase subunit